MVLKGMEAADVQAHLQALRKLYCLLQSSASTTSNEIVSSAFTFRFYDYHRL